MSKLASKILLKQNSAITAISPFFNKQIIFGTSAGELKIYDLHKKKYSWTEKTIGTPVAAFPFLNNKFFSRILSLEGAGFLVIRNTYAEIFTKIIGLHDSRGYGYRAKIFSNGEKVITAGYGGIIKMWSLKSGGYHLFNFASLDHEKVMKKIESIPCKIFNGHPKIVSDIAIFSNQEKIISGSPDGTLTIQNLETDRCITFGDTSDSILSLSLFPNDSKVVTGLSSGDLKIWDLENRKLLSILKGHKKQINEVMVFRDKRIISASDDGTLRIWDLEKEECVAILEGHTGEIGPFIFLPGDKQIVSGSGNGEIFLWDI